VSASEVAIQAPMLRSILALAGDRMLLVGGQALAFWAAYYGIDVPSGAVTKDADFVGTRADVERLARGLSGRAVYPHERAPTALVGQVRKDLPGGNYVNIDVLHRLYGDVTTQAIQGRAVAVEVLGGSIRVLHPLDVLQGRLENVHGLASKQDEHGLAQLDLAIRVVRAFLADEGNRDAQRPASKSNVRKHLARIEEMALSDAGRKVAKRHALFVADSLEPTVFPKSGPFRTRKLPQLLALMSPARRAEVAPF
jgi:hypothetical protein